MSNETKGWDVFFDNLKVMHYVGPMLEENHYYPFGLTMAGISDKALKGWYPENKYRYNKGSELQNKEFSDGSGLEIYTTELRALDPQLGRWWQMDSKIDQGYEGMSPYSAMNNDPILYNDFLGDEGEACCGGILNKIKELGVGLYNAAVTDARIINTYVNPATPFVELATGKSVESDFSADKSRKTSAVEAGVMLIPLGKVVGAIAKVGEKVVEKAGEKAVEKLAETTVDKAEKPRFIVEKDGVTVDTKSSPKGSYEQPNGGRTDVLQDKSHYNKTTKENVGQSHTHEPYSNTNPKTGETFTGADNNKAHRPTYEEVKNIETGKAKKITN